MILFRATFGVSSLYIGRIRLNISLFY